MTRDPNGIIWFNVNPGRGGIGRIDPKTEKIDVFIPPTGMSPTGGATTVDYDGKGRIWSSSPDGALLFDPKTEQFTEYKSVTFKTPNGTGITYGAAADRDGNGYWAEMILDIIGVGNGATGKAEEIKLAPVKAELDRVTPGRQKFYETYNQPDFNSPMPWAQGPRRMGTDKNADVLWVGNSWGANLARIDTKTNRRRTCRCRTNSSPITCGRQRARPWTNLWGADRVMRYDPKSAPGPRSTCRPAAPSRATSRCSNATARRPRWCCRISAPGRIAIMTLRSEAAVASCAVRPSGNEIAMKLSNCDEARAVRMRAMRGCSLQLVSAPASKRQ